MARLKQFARLKQLPRLRMVEWLGKKRVRLFFGHGGRVHIFETELPWVRSAKTAHIVDHGLGLDPGDGFEVSTWGLWDELTKAERSHRKRTSRRIRSS